MKIPYGMACLMLLITADMAFADCKEMVGKRVGVADIVKEIEVEDWDLVYYIFSSVENGPNISCGDRAFAIAEYGLGKMCKEGQRLSAEGELGFIAEENKYYVIADTVNCSDK